MFSLTNFHKITIITGHYGCGKTNFSINLALFLAQAREKVTVVDLDIVNPYFRTYDYKELFEQKGIGFVAPNFAGSNLDVPSLPASIPSLIANHDGYLIFDVGGDDSGAIALGQYATTIAQQDYEMLYIFNQYRFLTSEPEETVALLYDIERCSRLKVSALVNNSNLGPLTTRKTVEDTLPFAEKLVELTGLPIKCTTILRELTTENTPNGIFPIDSLLQAY